MAFSGWYPNSFIKMPYSGIANDFTIWPWHVGDLYYEVSGIESVLGFNPLNGYASIAARLTGIELLLPNTTFITGTTATENGQIPVYQINGHNIVAPSFIRIVNSSLTGVSGIFPTEASVAFIGSATKTFKSGYFDGIVINGVDVLDKFVNTAGDTMYGGLIINGSTLNVGTSNTLNGTETIAFGTQNRADGSRAVVMGALSSGMGNYSLGQGYYAAAMGSATTALGWDVKAIGNEAMAQGLNAEAHGLTSVAHGYYTIASGDYSYAHGAQVQALGQGTFVLGDSQNVNFYGSIPDALYFRFRSGVRLSSETDFLPDVTSVNKIGSPTKTFKSGYFDGLVINGIEYSASAGAGNVVGPASSTDSALALWDGTSGVLLKDSSVTITSNNIVPTASGTQDVGTSNLPFRNGYFKTKVVSNSFEPYPSPGIVSYIQSSANTQSLSIDFTDEIGLYAATAMLLSASGITLTADAGDVNLNPSTGNNVYVGKSVLPSSSGTLNVGSRNKTFKSGYFEGLVINGVEYSASAGAGDVTGPSSSIDNNIATFNGTTGKTIKDSNVTLSAGLLSGITGVLPTGSGTIDAGSSALAFRSGYFDSVQAGLINNKTVSTMKYFYIPPENIDGINNTFSVNSNPISSLVFVYQNGLRLAPSGTYADYDYYISGVYVVFTSPPAAGSKIIIDYAYLG